jgi:hypothetical protein
MLWSRRGCILCAGRTFIHHRTTFGRTGRSGSLPFDIFVRDRQTRTIVRASVQRPSEFI